MKFSTRPYQPRIHKKLHLTFLYKSVSMHSNFQFVIIQADVKRFTAIEILPKNKCNKKQKFDIQAQGYRLFRMTYLSLFTSISFVQLFGRTYKNSLRHCS